jgi:hypothetical protein
MSSKITYCSGWNYTSIKSVSPCFNGTLSVAMSNNNFFVGGCNNNIVTVYGKPNWWAQDFTLQATLS